MLNPAEAAVNFAVDIIGAVLVTAQCTESGVDTVYSNEPFRVAMSFEEHWQRLKQDRETNTDSFDRRLR